MKRSFVMIIALSFALMFSFIYLKIFVDDSAIVSSIDQAIVYYLQVGAFKSEKNALNRVDDLHEVDIVAMYYEKDNLFYVVTGFDVDVNKRDAIKDVLSSKGYGSYSQQMVVHDEMIISSIKNQSYEQLLEVMRSSK